MIGGGVVKISALECKGHGFESHPGGKPASGGGGGSARPRMEYSSAKSHIVVR